MDGAACRDADRVNQALAAAGQEFAAGKPTCIVDRRKAVNSQIGFFAAKARKYSRKSKDLDFTLVEGKEGGKALFD